MKCFCLFFFLAVVFACFNPKNNTAHTERDVFLSNQNQDAIEKIAATDFYSNYFGHKIEHLNKFLPLIQKNRCCG